MDRKTALITTFILLLVGLAAAFFLVRRTVTINLDGRITRLETAAFTTTSILQQAGVPITSADQVTPAFNDWVGSGATITIRTAKPVTLWVPETGSGETIYSTERIPSKILSQAGIALDSQDLILFNGATIPPDQPLPEASQYVLQIIKSRSATIVFNGQEKTLRTTSASLGAALWQAKIQLRRVDVLPEVYLSPLKQGAKISLQSAREIKVNVDGRQILARSGAPTVGQALVEAGIPLQGLDYSLPAENQLIPESGVIQVVRVREEVELKQTTLAYKSELVADPELELDQRRILQAGQEGIKVTRVLVRYENGKEVKRFTEAEWTAAEPQNQKTGYGTKVVIRTLDTPNGPIQYWRTARVWATSMHPCAFIPFIGQCSYTTANGSRLQKGVIGTGEAWYRLMANQGVYVEGYGKAIVADYGYVGGYWVDLGYSDADYVAWHQYTTLYWLTPVPANIAWILPP